jgi:hypothetical protein
MRASNPNHLSPKRIQRQGWTLRRPRPRGGRRRRELVALRAGGRGATVGAGWREGRRGRGGRRKSPPQPSHVDASVTVGGGGWKWGKTETTGIRLRVEGSGRHGQAGKGGGVCGTWPGSGAYLEGWSMRGHQPLQLPLGLLWIAEFLKTLRFKI